MILGKSIHELEPLELGGTAARQGFLFQDHVAAGFCLEMLLSKNLVAVWCETLDDVTLIRGEVGEQEVEFVQVKGEKIEQLWSVALLCRRDGNKIGSSVLEKLLANDRCIEPCWFRVVTRRPPAEELRILEAPCSAEARVRGSERMQRLCEALEAKLNSVQSANGNGPALWAERTLWEVGHSETSLQNRNLQSLGHAVDNMGRFLVSDQREQLYEFFLLKVRKAADSDKSLDRGAGKLSQDEFAAWFTEQVQLLEYGGSEAGGRALQEKLETAGIAEDVIASAQSLRRSYLARWLRPNYLERDVSLAWEDKVRAELLQLRASLDSGEISESGVEFHHRTLKALEELRREAPEGARLSKDFFHGCMYYITDVCQHRFVKVDV
ncbi:MAG: dsDNA nuclease domain-containing protein [Candidatus Binatia bacterium]